jgi:hypothetical protein
MVQKEASVVLMTPKGAWKQDANDRSLGTKGNPAPEDACNPAHFLRHALIKGQLSPFTNSQLTLWAATR